MRRWDDDPDGAQAKTGRLAPAVIGHGEGAFEN
jgi:hypothetical protein